MAKLKHVALIGTGIMGTAIGKHLLESGFELTVYNRTPERMHELINAGAHAASSLAEAAKGAELIFTMVGYPEDVEEVYLSSEGLLASAHKGAWLVDLTTSSPALARELAEMASLQGLHAVDCPVTGGESGARAGSLTLMLGATPDQVGELSPALESFSSKIFYFGEPGKGQAAKLCNQISLAGAMVGMAEALAFAEQTGVDVEQMLDMVGSGMGSSRAISDLAPKAVEGDWRPGFLNEHFRKDLGLALQRAEDIDLTLPGVETAYGLYDMLCTIGGERLGTQSLALCYQDEAASVAAGLDWSGLEHGDEGCDECEDCDGNREGHHHHHHHHHEE